MANIFSQLGCSGDPAKAKVRLPSDKLTLADRLRLDGPCRVYMMKRETPAEERATWPEDLQKMWQRMYGGDDRGQLSD